MKKETRWLFGGIVLAGIGFFIPLYFEKIWLALFIALLVGVVFMISLLRMAKDDFESKSAYRIVAGLVSLVVLFNAIAFAFDYGKKDFQTNLLLEIRKTIDKGVTKSDVQESLMYVLGQYHQNDRESIVATFRELMPEHLGEDGIYVSDFDLRKAGKDSVYITPGSDDEVSHFYETDEEEDEIRVFVVSEVALGEDPEYKNYDGQTGQFEMKFTLNEEGVNYEVLN